MVVKKSYAEVEVGLPVEGPFSYSIPEALSGEALPGKRVLVGFGKRVVTGYIVGLSEEAGVTGVKPLIDVLDAEPVFDEKRLKFFKWLSSYYFAPLGEVLSLTHPTFADVRSSRRVNATQEGLSAIEGLKGLEREILLLAGRGIAVSALAKRLRGKPVHSVVERLRKKGFLSEEVLIRGGGIRKEKHVSLPAGHGAPSKELTKRSPIQARVLAYLLENGESSINELVKSLGGVRDAVRRLEEKGLVEVRYREVYRDPFSDIAPRAVPHEPNEEQARAIEEISASIKRGGFSPFLLYGVTGSGKTLVYLKAIEEALKAGKKAIYMIPEIALTPWPAAYLTSRFPGRVALAHSGLSGGERYDEWRRMLSGGVDVVVGARSALFSPLKDLGIIIVDEEHEPSYKQEEGVRYNARDAALMLGKLLGITVVLGSATPSVETFHNATNGRFKLLSLKNRVMERTLPIVELVDQKGAKGQVISGRLSGLLEETFSSGHQALLFFNRRGFSSFLICRDCGKVIECPNCSVSLTVHKRRGTLLCHYCDFEIGIPGECPGCKGVNLDTPGAGTEKVEEEIRNLFPAIRVARMDRDTTRRKGSAKRIIEAVESRAVDLLIGTQMVSKGHHFPGVTLAGVVSGDTSLNIPDFRSSERTFQLITQAAGRAGRGDASGRVVVQTLNPDHYCLRNAATHDYEGFYRDEIRVREEALYPPFARLAVLRIEGPTEAAASAVATELRDASERLLKSLGKDGAKVHVLGPAPALISKLNGRYRWQILVKGTELRPMHAFIGALKSAYEKAKKEKISLTVDMDPASIA